MTSQLSYLVGEYFDVHTARHFCKNIIVISGACTLLLLKISSSLLSFLILTFILMNNSYNLKPMIPILGLPVTLLLFVVSVAFDYLIVSCAL